MTDIFQCEKSKTTCCSPKSAIKEQKIKNRRQQIRNEITGIKRQDTNELQYIDTKPRPQIGPVKPTLEHPVTNKYVCGVKGTYRYSAVRLRINKTLWMRQTGATLRKIDIP